MTDDGATLAAERPVPVMMAEGQVTLASTGRPVRFAVPADLTDDECLELVAWMTAPEGMRRMLRSQRRPTIVPAHGIVIPR